MFCESLGLSPSLSCHGGYGCERTRSPQTCPSAFPQGASSGSHVSPSLVTWACTGYYTHTWRPEDNLGVGSRLSTLFGAVFSVAHHCIPQGSWSHNFHEFSRLHLPSPPRRSGLQVLPCPALCGFSHLHGRSFPTVQSHPLKRLMARSSFVWRLHSSSICKVTILLELRLYIYIVCESREDSTGV